MASGRIVPLNRPPQASPANRLWFALDQRAVLSQNAIRIIPAEKNFCSFFHLNLFFPAVQQDFNFAVGRVQLNVFHAAPFFISSGEMEIQASAGLFPAPE